MNVEYAQLVHEFLELYHKNQGTYNQVLSNCAHVSEGLHELMQNVAVAGLSSVKDEITEAYQTVEDIIDIECHISVTVPIDEREEYQQRFWFESTFEPVVHVGALWHGSVYSPTPIEPADTEPEFKYFFVDELPEHIFSTDLPLSHFFNQERSAKRFYQETGCRFWAPVNNRYVLFLGAEGDMDEWLPRLYGFMYGQA